MLDKYPDVKSIKESQAHRQIVYSKVQKSIKPVHKDLLIKKTSYVSLSVDLSKHKNSPLHKPKNPSNKILPKISKSPE